MGRGFWRLWRGRGPGLSRGLGLVEGTSPRRLTKRDPDRSQGLPVSAGHLAQNASTSGNTTGVRFGRASVRQYLCICGTETKAQGCIENLICGGGCFCRARRFCASPPGLRLAMRKMRELQLGIAKAARHYYCSKFYRQPHGAVGIGENPIAGGVL